MTEQADDDAPSSRPRRSSKRPWIVALCALALALVGYRWWQPRAASKAEAERRQRAARAWANLQHCALGERLDAIDSIAGRVRLIELASDADEGGEAWPRRCSGYVTDLYGALGEQGPDAELRHQLRDRFRCEAQCVVDDPAKQLVGLAAAVSAAQLAPVEPSCAPPAMLATQLLSRGAFDPLGGDADAVVVGRDVRADGSVRLLLSRGLRASALCELHPDDAAPRCHEVTLPVAPTNVALVKGSDVAAIAVGADDDASSY